MFIIKVIKGMNDCSTDIKMKISNEYGINLSLKSLILLQFSQGYF